MSSAAPEFRPIAPRRTHAQNRLLVTRIWLSVCAVALVVGCFVPVVKTRNVDKVVVGTMSLWDWFRQLVTGGAESAGTPQWLAVSAATAFVGSLVVAALCVLGVLRGLPGWLVALAGLLSAWVAFFSLMLVLNGLVATKYTAMSLAWGAGFFLLGAWAALIACLVPPIRKTWGRS